MRKAVGLAGRQGDNNTFAGNSSVYAEGFSLDEAGSDIQVLLCRTILGVVVVDGMVEDVDGAVGAASAIGVVQSSSSRTAGGST